MRHKRGLTRAIIFLLHRENEEVYEQIKMKLGRTKSKGYSDSRRVQAFSILIDDKVHTRLALAESLNSNLKLKGFAKVMKRVERVGTC